MISLGIIPACYESASENQVGPGTFNPIGFTASELASLYWKINTGTIISMSVSIDETIPGGLRYTGSGSFFLETPWRDGTPTASTLLCNGKNGGVRSDTASTEFLINLHVSTGGGTNIVLDWRYGVDFSTGYTSQGLYYPYSYVSFNQYFSFLIDSSTPQALTVTFLGKPMPLYGPLPVAFFAYGGDALSANDTLTLEVATY